jgi:hypothetical protein
VRHPTLGLLALGAAGLAAAAFFHHHSTTTASVPPARALLRASAAGGPGRGAPPASDAERFTAEGPYTVNMADVPVGQYDPDNPYDTGRWRESESILPEAEVERLQQEAMALPPSDRVQRVAGGPPTRAFVTGAAFDSIDTLGCCGGGASVPPDPEMAAGPNHVISTVNVAFLIQDTTGAVLVGPTTFSSFFSAIGGNPCAGYTDPNVLYDESADRFFLGIDAGGPGAQYCFAVSQTGDPTGFWNLYHFAANVGGNFFDFPQAAVGRDAIYMGGNMFAGVNFAEGRVWAMDKAAAYAGGAVTVVSLSTSGDSTPQPMHLHGWLQGTWPTSGPEYILTDDIFDGATYGLLTWTDPFGSNVLAAAGTVDLNAATGVVAGFPINAPQSGGGTLQNNDWRGLDAEWRNGHIWITNAIACNPGAGTVNCVRWAEVDPSGPSVVQAGVFSSNGDHRIRPDLAVDQCNDMAVGYTKTNTSIFPAVWVTGREAGDTPGTVQAETSIKAGEVNYTAFDGSPHRWGDYSGMTVGPDGSTFWYLGEYSKSIAAAAKWGNYIGSFRFASCSVVFADGFESGDTSAWSATVP